MPSQQLAHLKVEKFRYVLGISPEWDFPPSVRRLGWVGGQSLFKPLDLKGGFRLEAVLMLEVAVEFLGDEGQEIGSEPLLAEAQSVGPASLRRDVGFHLFE